MFYNKEMFEKLNLEVPETFDDFLTVCQTFLDNGITPLTVGGKEPWTIAMYHDLLALRAVGSEGVKAATGKETGYDDPGFLEAFPVPEEAGGYGRISGWLRRYLKRRIGGSVPSGTDSDVLKRKLDGDESV